MVGRSAAVRESIQLVAMGCIWSTKHQVRPPRCSAFKCFSCGSSCGARARQRPCITMVYSFHAAGGACLVWWVAGMLNDQKRALAWRGLSMPCLPACCSTPQQIVIAMPWIRDVRGKENCPGCKPCPQHNVQQPHAACCAQVLHTFAWSNRSRLCGMGQLNFRV